MKSLWKNDLVISNYITDGEKKKKTVFFYAFTVFQTSVLKEKEYHVGVFLLHIGHVHFQKKFVFVSWSYESLKTEY